MTKHKYHQTEIYSLDVLKYFHPLRCPGVEGQPAPLLLWGSDPVDVIVDGFPRFPQELPAASYSSASVTWPRTVMRRKYRRWSGKGRIGRDCGGKISRKILLLRQGERNCVCAVSEVASTEFLALIHEYF